MKKPEPTVDPRCFCRHEVSLFVCGLETEDSSTRRKCFSSAMQGAGRSGVVGQYLHAADDVKK